MIHNVLIDGIRRSLWRDDGMTGIGSRDFSIDGKKFPYGIVQHSEDVTAGNHFLYLINWRERPWDKVYIIISEDHVSHLLEGQPDWRNAQKVSLPV